MTRGSNNSGQQLFWHLTAVKPFAFLEGPSDTSKVPSVVMWAERVRGVLRPGDPSVIRQSSIRIGSVVGVYQLPRRFDTDLWVHAVKGEFLFVFYKVKQMGVGAAKTVAAIDAKRVVPDDPTAAVKTGLLRSDL